MASAPASLFGSDLPDGFQYRDDFITRGEERALAAHIARIEFSTFEMRGVVARRRVAFFGRSYDAGGATASPMPEFLYPLRDKIAEWADVDARAFSMALINEYAPGAPIGWHRDAPQYDIVAGVSLLSPARMKFRAYVRPTSRPAATGKRTATHEIVLQPRSAYVMKGEARNAYEHHIPAGNKLRYSITFRTLR